MKTVLLISVLIASTIITQAQYQTLPDSNAVWSVMESKFFISGDSLHNGYLYKKYNKSNGPTLTTGVFYALLREDSLTQRIYTVPADSSQERLLYDFSLNVNDTVSVYPSVYYYNSQVGNTVRVIAIDSILIGIAYHKRLSLKSYNFGFYEIEYWIEGVGSTYGLFYPDAIGSGVVDGCLPSLLCVVHNGITLYDDTAYASCYELCNKVGFKTETVSLLTTFPNPTTTTLTINAAANITSLRMYNGLGQEVINNVYTIVSTTQTIPVSTLPNGIYMLQVTTVNNNISTQKIVIIN
ncbi:MAG: T9SS type A sorting domain-containing protein [Bacteroidia bacterium]|nr:T9SS type A sorting domain-containing protein [Bacteroidia bacterium]